MNCLIVLSIALIAFVAANADEKPNKIGHGPGKPGIESDCIEKSGVSQEQLRILRQREHTNDKAAHEYLLCTLKGKFFSEENGFNVDAVVAQFTSSHLDEQVARELAAKCLDHNEQKSTPAAWVYRGVSCLDDNNIDELLREARRKFNENNTENKV